MRGVEALRTGGIEDKAIIRQTPAHCIVQLGPVAITLAWLRSTIDTAADGQLMVIVWQGIVAPQVTHRPEQDANKAGPARAATVVWEDALVAVGSSEATWMWQRKTADGPQHSSAELAALCVQRLHAAFTRAPATAPRAERASPRISTRKPS